MVPRYSRPQTPPGAPRSSLGTRANTPFRTGYSGGDGQSTSNELGRLRTQWTQAWAIELRWRLGCAGLA